MITAMRLTLDIEYKLKGLSPVQMRNILNHVIQTAVGNGLLTSDTNAEVETWSSDVCIVPKAPSEEDMVDYFNQRVADGNMDIKDLVMKAVRSGMQEMPSFVDEMRERMNFEDEVEVDSDDTPQAVVDRIVAGFSSELEKILLDNESFINEASARLDIFDEKVEEMRDEAIDGLKSALGANASNEFEDEADQDEAISMAEEWVADNISNAGFEKVLASILWAEGLEKGCAVINAV